jgi:hypothetical protein
MDVRYYRDAESGLPHIFDHGVTEAEVEWVLARPAEDGPCSRGSRQTIGKTEQGRYLRVIYVPNDDGRGIFVVTAYPVIEKQLKAFRRRERRRQQ